MTFPVPAANDLFYLTVKTNIDGRQILAITGHRDTVLEAALRAILDAAPTWDVARGISPAFAIDVSRFQA